MLRQSPNTKTNHNAKLYTPPKSDIPLYMAAVGKESVKVAAEYSDGLITFLKPKQSKELFQEFDKAAKEAGKDYATMEKIAEYKLLLTKIMTKHFSRQSSGVPR